METEIKFRVDDVEQLEASLRAAGFREQTVRTHELNTLYDLAGLQLSKRSQLLRLRKYGERWVLTHKSGRTQPGDRHKSREETETAVEDGAALDKILRALGFQPVFTYEKFRSEWTDDCGDLVIDETPVGNFAELEGAPRWIDEIAARIGVSEDQYITGSYAELFVAWKRRTGSDAQNMTFAEVGGEPEP
ncbi:MAG TPA: class IV adenylate cyclase [Terriglobales bacterium]|nr:class IV adenylate cyclase [Terriglobales bacterium]